MMKQRRGRTIVPYRGMGWVIKLSPRREVGASSCATRAVMRMGALLAQVPLACAYECQANAAAAMLAASPIR
jgi:hypothetical protein